MNNEQYFKWWNIKHTINEGALVDWFNLWDKYLEMDTDPKNYEDNNKIWNELYNIYSEPLDYEKLFKEFNDGTMPAEIVNYLIKYIKYKENDKTYFVEQNINTKILNNYMIFGLIILKLLIIIIFIKKYKVKFTNK